MQTHTSNALHNAIIEDGGKDRPPMLAPGIDNDIYSTVDACPNACEMWKAIERLKQGESINVQDLKTNLYWEFGKFTSQDGESLESYYSRSQQAATRNRGKTIVNSPLPIYDQEPTMAEDDEMSKDKEIDKLMALISLSFKKIYKPTNNNLRTSSNTSIGNQDNSLRISRGTGYDNQMIVNVTGARDYRECHKPKRAKDATYHKEKMLLCKQKEAGFQLNAEQADWKDDTNDEPEDQELEAHYMYMAQIQEVNPAAADNSGPIFDSKPLQKVPNNDNYNVFAIESEHPEQSKSVNDTYPIKQDEHNMIIDSLDMSYDRDQVDQDDDDDLANKRDLLASLIEKLKCEIDDNKNRNKFLETSNKVLVDKLKFLLEIRRINADLEKFHLCLKEEMVADLRYFNSLELEVDSLKSQLETQKTQFLNKIDRLLREYYYADHMNAILGVYTELDEVTNLQCDYLETLEKYECLEKELSKSKMMSTSFEALQKHAINLELDLQQCKEKIKNDKSFKENQSKEFRKEHEQYFEIQILKAQLQDKGITTSELKKLIEKLKGKSVETKFEKSSVIREPNAFKSQRPSILGKLTIFSDSLKKNDCSKSKSVTKNNVSNDLSKPVTAQILPPNNKSIIKNTNVIAPRMSNPPTSVSRPQLKSIQIEDRVMLNNSQGKKQKVEDHRRNVKFSNNKTSVSACNDSLNAKTLNVKFFCVTCGKCVLNDNHDKCVLHYHNGMNSRTKMPMAVPINTREPKRIVNQSIATPLRRTVASKSTNQKPRHITRKLYASVSKTCSWWYPKFTPPGYKWKPKSQIGNVNPKLVEIILFIVDSGCSKHMTGSLKLLTNFVEKFLGSVKFGNDQIAPILGYGDLVQGTVTIKCVYYVEGLNHNLFSVGQFCYADLEVAFWKSTCYIRDFKGNDLLTGSCGADLYSITLQDTSSPNPICLMAKATSSQAWLWHRRLSHLNFDTINLLSKNDIVIGLIKLKFIKDHLCSSCELGKAKRKYTWTHFLRSKDETPEVLIDFLRLIQRGLHAQVRIVRTGKGTEFLNKTLHAYFSSKGIQHQTSVARTPEQNGEMILFYKVFDVPTRQILDSKGADHSQKWKNETSTRCRISDTSDGLAAIQAQLNNLGREIKKERHLNKYTTLNLVYDSPKEEDIKQLLWDSTKEIMEILRIKSEGKQLKNH
nr:hypothetical protein [Tanacetum cinerariifolium]